MSANQPTLMERLELLAINLIATAVISILLEKFVGIPRLYQLESGLFSWCSPGFAFPSGHFADAFPFVFPFIGNTLFPISYFIALLVSWSQVSQGLHSLLDIGGGLAVAGLGYSIAEAIILKQKNVINRKNELPRKAAHIASNLSACLLIWLIGIPVVSSLFLAATCIGILMIGSLPLMCCYT
jgi:membrane-associated phospholipid phosphatase